MEKYRQRRLCPSCFKAGQLSKICSCCCETLDLEYEAQPPKVRASKMRWKEFFKEWYPNLNFDELWNRRRK